MTKEDRSRVKRSYSSALLYSFEYVVLIPEQDLEPGMRGGLDSR